MLLRYFDRADIEADFLANPLVLTVRPTADTHRLLRDSAGEFTFLGGAVMVLARTASGLVLYAGSRAADLNDISIGLSQDR